MIPYSMIVKFSSDSVTLFRLRDVNNERFSF